jgi:hypothetical protein
MNFEAPARLILAHLRWGGARPRLPDTHTNSGGSTTGLFASRPLDRDRHWRHHSTLAYRFVARASSHSAQLTWLAPDEPTRQETGDPGTVRQFSNLRDAVVFTLEGLPERYRGSARIKVADGSSLDFTQIKRVYTEIIKS